MYQPLGLAKAIGRKHAIPVLFLVADHPFMYILHYFILRLPLIDRKAERAFSDEGVTLYRFKLGRNAIMLRLIITGDNPGLSLVFYRYLCRADDMPGGIKGNIYTVNGEACTITRSFYYYVPA
jgi:hypothetical protein